MTVTPGIPAPGAPLVTRPAMDLVTPRTPDTTTTPARGHQAAPHQAPELPHIIQELAALLQARVTPPIPPVRGPAPPEVLMTPDTRADLLDLPADPQAATLATQVTGPRQAGTPTARPPPELTPTTEAGAEAIRARGRAIQAPGLRADPSLQYRAHPRELRRQGRHQPPSHHTRDTRRTISVPAMDRLKVRAPPSPAVPALATPPQGRAAPQVTPGPQAP